VGLREEGPIGRFPDRDKTRVARRARSGRVNAFSLCVNTHADIDGGEDGHWEVLLRKGDARASVIVPPVVPLTAELVARIAKAELADYEVVTITFHAGSQRVR
jgi:hypothetical protein